MSQQLNKKQKQAIEYTEGPLLIVAGAGTGKTTVVSQKIAYLIKNKLAKPEEILAVTFTDKAANEMEERVDSLLNIGYADMQISTFHAFCQRILEHYGLDIGLSNQFRLLDSTDSWLLVRENLDKFNLDYYRPLGNPTKHFSKCKDELISPADYLEYAENIKLESGDVNTEERSRLTEISSAYHTYNQLLLDNNALDFGDLIFYTTKLLEERPLILEKLRKRFKYILVDEFQDVNWAQYKLTELLTGDKGQLTVVGDDDQSIFAFRGASVSNILRFKKDYPKAKEIVLTENYRSGQKILDTAYNSIQNNNPDRLETKLKINKKLESKAGVNSEILHLHHSNLEEEASGIIKKIIELKTDEIKWDDFAILIRANSHAEPFASALESSGIPYEFLASSGLYRQPIVLDCINFFKLIDSYHESNAIFRLLQMPFLNFKEDDLQKLTYLAKKKSIPYYGALERAGEFKLSKEGIDVCNLLLRLINKGMQESRYEKPTAVLIEFLESSGYYKYLVKEEEAGNREAIRQIYQLKQWFDHIRKYEQIVHGAKVSDFVEHYKNITDSGDEGSLYQPTDTPDSINIITIHRAKGLEFKYVFVVNLIEGRFPSTRRREAIQIPDELVKEQLPEGDFHEQEERRLFYVALTRAKEKLFLTSASSYGGKRKRKISRFLAELGFEDAEEKEVEMMKKTVEIEEKGKIVFQTPKTLSYSKINSYQRCPYQYKLMHVLQIPTKGSPHLSFGQSMHSTMHKFYEKVIELNSAKQTNLFGSPEKSDVKKGGTQVPKFEELLEMYESSWIDSWYKDKKQREKYYQKGKDLLREYYKSQSDWTVPISLEGWFKIKIGEYFINGRIDRIDRLEDGTLEIIDYKTGKSKEKIVGDDKNQLLIYQIAAQTLPEYRNEGETSKLTFHYFEGGIEASFIGKEKDLEKLEEKIIDVTKGIEQCKFGATPGQHVCKYCDFKDICEYRRL